MHAIDPSDLSADTIETIIWVVGILVAIAVYCLIAKAR